MSIIMPETILNTIHFVVQKTSAEFYRDGIQLEKNAIISARRINKNRSLYEKICHMWSIYPDLYIKIITPIDSKFKLNFF